MATVELTLENFEQTITDNDTATWSLAQSGSPVTEGGDVAYTISLAGTFDENETGTVVVGLTEGTTTTADHGDLVGCQTHRLLLLAQLPGFVGLRRCRQDCQAHGWPSNASP